MGAGGYRDQAVYVRRDNRFRRDRFERRDFQPRFSNNQGKWRRFENMGSRTNFRRDRDQYHNNRRGQPKSLEDKLDNYFKKDDEIMKAKLNKDLEDYWDTVNQEGKQKEETNTEIKNEIGEEKKE